MKYKILILSVFLLCVFSIIKSQQPAETTHIAIPTTFKVSTDTLKIQSLDKPALKKWYDSGYAIWGVQLLIALLTVAVAKNTVKTQIKNSIDLASLQFQATLNSTNRQEWINDVRHTLSDLVTQCKQLNAVLQERPLNKELKLSLHEKVTYNRYRLLLLLDDRNKDHQDLVKEVRALIDLLDIHILAPTEGFKYGTGNSNLADKYEVVLKAGRDLLYNEWGKMQKLSFKKPIN